MRIDIITIFPDLFPPYLNESLLKRAQKKKLLEFRVHNLRDFTSDKHRKVDDRPYGGGPGMILKIEPLVGALKFIANSQWPIGRRERRGQMSNVSARGGSASGGKCQVSVIAMDPAGKQLTQKMAQRLARYDQLVLIAGRYEGYDARLFEFVDEPISIGPYVLAGGELPALVLTDTVTRQIPGVLGDPDSLKEETHSTEGFVEYPQFTRPESLRYKIHDTRYKTLRVPKVLLSGNHAKIAAWRKKHSKR